MKSVTLMSFNLTLEVNHLMRKKVSRRLWRGPAYLCRGSAYLCRLLAAMLLATVVLAGPVSQQQILAAAANQPIASESPLNQTGLDGDATPASPQPTPTPELGAAVVDYAPPPAGKPGFYIENGRFDILQPAPDYFATGSFLFWAWAALNPSPGKYNWDALDQWIQDSLDAGYQTVGLAIMTYTGRFVACPIQGVDMTPSWVLAGPDQVAGNSDDPLLVSNEPDARGPDKSPDCTNTGGPWYLLDYLNPWYNQQYEIFVKALAEHLLTHPHRANIAWVATGTGKDGENKPADDKDDPSLQAGGLDQSNWVGYVQHVMDVYTTAFYDGSGFPRIQVINQNAPFFLSPLERRDVANYAAVRNVGLSINNITADFNSVESCGSLNPNVKCTGIYDQARQYNGIAPIMLESYDYMMGTPNEFYWAMQRALDVKADYIRLSHFWTTQTNQVNLTTAEWASKYVGTGFKLGQQQPPTIWSTMREHKDPCYLNYAYLNPCNYWPTSGNYEFYLTQLNLPEYGGITIPVTDDGGPANPDRVRITGWDGGDSPVKNERWHTNYSPHSPEMLAAGLFQIASSGVQNQVDPGYVARRSDQATGHSKFIFDAADRYFTRQSDQSAFKVIITVTYLDHGNDQWLLVYDGVSGPNGSAPLRGQ